jgi:hypothetical protein
MLAAEEVEGKAPEGEGGGEDVGVGEGALGEPDGVDGGEEGSGEGGGDSGKAADEAVDGREGGGADEADKGAGGEDREAKEAPPAGEEDGRQRGVGVRSGGLGDEGAGVEEVPGGGDVVAGLVPEIGEMQQRDMGQEDGGEGEGEELPEADGESAALPRCGVGNGAPSGQDRPPGGDWARGRAVRRFVRTAAGCGRGR